MSGDALIGLLPIGALLFLGGMLVALLIVYSLASLELGREIKVMLTVVCGFFIVGALIVLLT